MNEAEKQDLIFLTKEQLSGIYEKAADVGAKAAIKKLEEERSAEFKQRGKRKLRNTKLLLRNYNMLKKHAENSVFGRTQMGESATDILEAMMSLYNDDVIIESIKNSATRTAIIVAHIETMLDLYYTYCRTSPYSEVDMRRYEIVWSRYISDEPMSVKDIANKYHISKENVYKDINIGIERLTALIFGVDGLR